MKQESTFSTRTNSSEQEMHEKTRVKSTTVARQEYSIDISEEYEYSHEKVERVSLHTRMLGSNLFRK